MVKKANALDLNFIESKTIDWIDTDGFFSFFDRAQLNKLFIEWKRILNDNGFISFRELVSSNPVSMLANKIRALVTLPYMGIKLNLHSMQELREDFQELEFKFKSGRSPFPFLNRYCLINSSIK